MILPVRNRYIYQFGVLGLFRGCQDERWVGGCILWFIFVDGCKIAGIADHGGASGLQLIKGGTHGVYFGGYGDLRLITIFEVFLSSLPHHEKGDGKRGRQAY